MQRNNCRPAFALLGLAALLVGCGRSSPTVGDTSASAPSPAPSKPAAFAVQSTEQKRVVRVRPPSAERGVSPPGGKWLVEETLELEVPVEMAAFDEWVGRYRAAGADARRNMVAEGVVLAKVRRERMARLIEERPRDAILLAITPSLRGELPEEVLELMESLVTGEGFYGVLVICDHDPASGHTGACRIEYDVAIGDAHYKASIYGTRRERLTEENASLYGVALDGRLALHEDDYVVLPATAVSSDPIRASHLALVHRGETTFFPDLSALEAHLDSALSFASPAAIRRDPIP